MLGFVDNVIFSSVRFNVFEGLALDGANCILYVVDIGNYVVRVIDLFIGVVMIVLGDGMIFVSGVVFDFDGIFFILVRFNYSAGIAYNFDFSFSSGVLLVMDWGMY